MNQKPTGSCVEYRFSLMQVNLIDPQEPSEGPEFSLCHLSGLTHHGSVARVRLWPFHGGIAREESSAGAGIQGRISILLRIPRAGVKGLSYLKRCNVSICYV